MSRRAGWPIALGGLLFIGVMTLRPEPHAVQLAALTPPTCLLCGSLGLMDVLLNILLFIPYGLGLGLAGLGRRRTMILVVATTLAVELTQEFFIVGRDASLSDLLTNTAGGALGLILSERWRLLLAPQPRTARRLAAVAAAVWLVVQGVTAWALHPSLPETVWWGQRTPELGQFDHFAGTLVEARLGGDSLPSTRLPDSRTMRRRLLTGPAKVEAAVRTGEAPARLAPIASVFDEHQHEVLLLGQWGRDAYFRIRLRASDLLLRSPGVRLADVFPSEPGHPLTLAGQLDGAQLSVEADQGSARRVYRVTLSPSLGWGLLVPWENYAWGTTIELLTAAWLAGLLLPFGYWLRLGWTGGDTGWWRTAALAVALLVAGLGVTAVLAGFPVPGRAEWGAAAIGIMAGSLLAGPAAAQALAGIPPSARSASSP
jgi:hypothetical protein